MTQLEAIKTPSQRAVARAGRITGLDWIRGLMLVASVTVNSLLSPPGWFGHAEWAEVHPEDLIFPIFVVLSGCGLGLSMRSQVRLMVIFRRATLLVVIGILYNAIQSMDFAPIDWRFTGVLQTYAAVTLVLGLLHLWTKRWWAWLLIAAAFATAQTVLLTVFALGCDDRTLSPTCNPSGVLDPLVFSQTHTFQSNYNGYDPEGIVSMMGALVCASIGAAIAHLLVRLQRRADGGGSARPQLAIVPVLSVAAGAVVFGLILVALPHLVADVDIPVMKKLWTAPFALFLSAGAVTAILLGHLIMDRQKVTTTLRRFSFPLIALGRNSLLVYFGSHILTTLLFSSADGKWEHSLGARIQTSLPEGFDQQVPYTLILLAFWISLASFLHWRRWYVRL
jgi:heparan-alpha-glucosaminide N-acetyltransferase